MIFQRRHDCIHNCDRPKIAPQALALGGTVLKVIEDVDFLVLRCDEHINSEFRAFLAGVSARGGYCLDCLSEIYGEPSTTVTGYLSEIGISARQDRCANCDEYRETFRADTVF